MGLWKSTVKGAGVIAKRSKTVTHQVGIAARWVGEQNWFMRSLKFTGKTSFEMLRVLLALEKAVPYLINNKEARNIVYDMVYVTTHDIAPMMAVYWSNHYLQNYYFAPQEEQKLLSFYTLFLGGLTLAHYSSMYYTLMKDSEALLHSFTLDSVSAAVFNANKTTRRLTSCAEQKCTNKGFMKGSIREPMVLIGNDLLTFLLSFLPYLGQMTGILNVFIMGRYITRIATPQRCERHKNMVPESVLALGLMYLLSTTVMDKALNATIGLTPQIEYPTSQLFWLLLQITPKIIYRVLSHFILLMHINLAAHMVLPLDTSETISPFAHFLDIYERIVRFIADVVIAGLQVRIPQDFKLQKKGPPLISLASALAFFTRVLDSDLPRVHAPSPPDASKKIKEWLIVALVPYKFRSIDNFVNDRLIQRHWVAISNNITVFIDVLNAIGKTNKISIGLLHIAEWSPEHAAKIINYKWGIPKSVSILGLKLNKKEDFWALAQALRSWLDRHKVGHKETLAKGSPEIPLRGHQSPRHLLNQSPDSELPQPINIAPEQLISRRSSDGGSKGVINPNSLFSTRIPQEEISEKKNVLEGSYFKRD